MKSYEKTYNILKKRILDRQYEPDKPLPPERQLCSELGISRITLRHSIRMLQQRGFVDSIQGRGTYVRSSNPDKIAVFNNDFVGSVIRNMPNFQRVLLKFEKVCPPEYILKLFKIKSDKKCLLAERLDIFEDTPFSYDRSYIPEEFTGSIDSEILRKVDFYNIWIKRESIKITNKTESIEAVKADKLAVERLKCEPGSPLLLTTETMYNDKNNVFSVFESYYRGDLIKLISRK